MTKEDFIVKMHEIKGKLEDEDFPRIVGRKPLVTKIEQLLNFVDMHKTDDELHKLLIKEIESDFDGLMFLAKPIMEKRGLG